MDNEEFEIDSEFIFCDDPAQQAAIDSFGIKYLFPWQRLVIANIIDAYENIKNPDLEFSDDNTFDDTDDTLYKGRQIVLLPTGAGKSLCFQIPAILLDGPTLVIYPLLALMSDQERRMENGNLECVIFRGGQTAEERKNNFEKIKNGAKIIIANPEILLTGEILEELCKCNISHIAIDEAHCVSEWGDSFRPAYLELGKIIKAINAPVVTAFTATASPEVLARVSEVLFDGDAHIVRSDSDRPNIHYYVKKTACKKTSALFLAKTEIRPMIIFCSSRNRTEEMAREINFVYGNEVARFYHAGLEREEKTEIEKWFFEQKDAVLCATCAYGMGVDKKDIRTVVHLDAPETAEAYIQEAGRGGRDGGVANAILLWDYEDEKKFSKFEKGTRKSVMYNFVKTTECRRQVLLDALGGEEAVCDGCDLCDNRKREANGKKSFFHIPADELPLPQNEIFKIIKKNNKFYNWQTLEEKYLPIINEYSRKFTNVNIWWHEDFENCLNQLKFENKIRILRNNQKIIIKNNEKKKSKLTLLLLQLHLRVVLLEQARQVLERQISRAFSASVAFLHNLLRTNKNAYRE